MNRAITFIPLLSICIFSAELFAQGQGQGITMWKTNGNQASDNDFAGTVNEKDMIWKTFNEERMRIRSNGHLLIKEFAETGGSGGGGLLSHDIEGRVRNTPFTGIFNQVINGHGAFSNIIDIAGFEKTGTSINSADGANVGINNPNPIEKLDVIGNIKISGKVFIKELQFTDNTTSGFPKVGIIKYHPDAGPIKEGMTFGSSEPVASPCTTEPVLGPRYQFKGTIQSWAHTQWDTSKQINILTMGFDGWNGIIDMAGDNGAGGPNLLLNYICGKNVIIGNQNSGTLIANHDVIVNHKLFVHKNVDISGEALFKKTANFGSDTANSVQIFNETNGKGRIESNGGRLLMNWNNKMNPIEAWSDLIAQKNFYAGNSFLANANGTSVNIGSQTSDPNPAIKFKISNGGKAKFENGNGWIEMFYNGHNGRIDQFGSGGLLLNWASENEVSAWGDFVVFDKAEGIPIFKVRKEDNTTYARAITLPTDNFPDYVFRKDYKLNTILEVETFINKNGRLPNIPSATVVKEKGLNLGEIVQLEMEKIEEQMLYIIELKKENMEMKEEIKALRENQNKKNRKRRKKIQ